MRKNDSTGINKTYKCIADKHGSLLNVTYSSANGYRKFSNKPPGFICKNRFLGGAYSRGSLIQGGLISKLGTSLKV